MASMDLLRCGLMLSLPLVLHAFTPDQVLCFPNYECRPDRRVITVRVKTQAECALACSNSAMNVNNGDFLDNAPGCKAFSFNARRPEDMRCRISIHSRPWGGPNTTAPPTLLEKPEWDQEGASTTNYTYVDDSNDDGTGLGASWAGDLDALFEEDRVRVNAMYDEFQIGTSGTHPFHVMAGTNACNLDHTKKGWTKVCYIKPYVYLENFDLMEIAENAYCYRHANNPADGFLEYAGLDQFACAKKCASLMGCKIFSHKEVHGAHHCAISACLLDDNGNFNKSLPWQRGCTSGAANGLDARLDNSDLAGSCWLNNTVFTSEQRNSGNYSARAYRLKFKKGGEAHDSTMQFGTQANCGPGANQATPMIQRIPIDRTAAGHRHINFVPQYLIGGQFYSRSHLCTSGGTDPTWELEFTHTPGVKAYILALASDIPFTNLMNSLGWTLEDVVTGESTMVYEECVGDCNDNDLQCEKDIETQSYLTGCSMRANMRVCEPVCEPIAVYSFAYQQEPERHGEGAPPPSAAKIPIPRAISVQTVLGLVVQSANPVAKAIECPGVVKVSGGGVSWNEPRKLYQVTLAHPHDKGWETTMLEHWEMSTRGKIVTNHIENVIHNRETKTDTHVNKFPGVGLGNWAMDIEVRAPTDLCILVWDGDNRICSNDDPKSLSGYDDATMLRTEDWSVRADLCPMTKSARVLDAGVPDFIVDPPYEWKSPPNLVVRSDTGEPSKRCSDDWKTCTRNVLTDAEITRGEDVAFCKRCVDDPESVRAAGTTIEEESYHDCVRCCCAATHMANGGGFKFKRFCKNIAEPAGGSATEPVTVTLSNLNGTFIGAIFSRETVGCNIATR